MKISFNEVKNILEKLPIGIYTQRRIDVELSRDAETSYYSLMEDNIVIAYNNILASLASIEKDDNYAETAIRSILYHEVSHALMTPKDMMPTDILNIFEDERIETILAYYYKNINFKRNVLYLNGYNGEAPRDALDEFYQVVRYRHGDSYFVNQVEKLIEKYEFINSYHTDDYNEYYKYMDMGKDINVNDYIKDVYNLYNQIASKWGEPQKNYYNDQNSMNGKSQAGGFLNNGSGDKQVQNGKDNSQGSGNEEGQAPCAVKAGEGDKADELLEEAISKQAGSQVDSPDTLINNLTNKFFDSAMTESLQMILSNFNKKNTGGSSICSYSGVFNPRNVLRNDYKYFDHKMPVNGNNIFGTFHLNLFLDDSGSMSNNESIINKLIYSLIQVEHMNSNFTFDVYTCADRIEKADKKKGYQARGGTYLRKSIVPLYINAQKPQTFNYNLVLFDGEASVDKYLNGNTFKVFDNNATTVITDDSNRRHLKGNTVGKVIYCNNYAEELIENVYKVLQGAFR